MSNTISYLQELESESTYIIREAYSQFNKTVILFSGGKDSIVLTHLAMKAFWPAPIPFTLVHIDTGHNFKEVISFRDEFMKKHSLNLKVGKVQDTIDEGLVSEETGVNASRNRLQTTTLLNLLQSSSIDACIGGARRDEEKARAKERFFSHRDDFGQWNPKNQRPELWNLFNGNRKLGESFRVFPLSNWTELDIWNYISEENIELPSLYYSHTRDCFKRNKTLLAANPYQQLQDDEVKESKRVRFRTMGDITITGAVESTASNPEEVILEIRKSEFSERGERADDKVSQSSMEDRKTEGYF